MQTSNRSEAIHDMGSSRRFLFLPARERRWRRLCRCGAEEYSQQQVCGPSHASRAGPRQGLARSSSAVYVVCALRSRRAFQRREA